MGWWDGELASFDTETTGVDPFEARIVTATVILRQSDGKETSRFRLLVNPGAPIPKVASDIHGVTDEKAAEGISPIEALASLGSVLRRLEERAVPVVIYNASYDWTLLHAECERHGRSVPPALSLIDPLVLDRAMDKYRCGGRKLIDTCGVYGVELGNAHDSLFDARAALEVARKIAYRYPEIQVSAEELQPRQAQYFEEWRVGINEFWQAKGKTDRVPPGWPRSYGGD